MSFKSFSSAQNAPSKAASNNNAKAAPADDKPAAQPGKSEAGVGAAAKP